MTAFWVLIAGMFAMGLRGLYRRTLSEDELWEELHGRR